MVWQWTPYTLPLAVAGLLSVGLLVVIYRNREKRGASALMGVLVAAICWSVGDGVRLSTTDRTVKLLALNVRFLGPILVTPSVFLFAAEYTNRDRWLTPRRITALFAFHAITFTLVWTNQFHHLVWETATLDRSLDFVVLDIEWGTWYYLHAAYSYLLLVGAAWMLVDKLRQSGDVSTYRGQSITILVATIVPWAINAAYIADVTPVDLTALGFTVMGSMFAIAMFRYQILDIVPIARSTVVDNIDEGYLVLDPNDAVVDVNQTAVSIIGTDKDTIIGQTFQEIFADYPEIADRFGESRDIREQMQLDQDGETQYYDVDVSPIFDSRDNYTGRVVLFRDITDQERRKRQLERQKSKLEHQTAQLERQNDRLEDFASIVSHDLRNPINVVSGRMELARRDPADEHFEEMEEGIDRMEAIIDDVLTMARQGQTVDDPESIHLADLCTDAWQNVETRDASLEVETDRTIEGDRTRLLQVFENLFRNALDHGPDDVTITVGDLPDGFYVEDDGPGIPESEREDVLEKGYTTAEDGTGFGLSIVQTAIESHGWEIDVTEGTDGGARFEITGLDTNGGRKSEPILED